MTKKTRIRIWIIVTIVLVMWFSDWSFADNNEKLTILWRSINYIVSVSSWLWIIFAKIAWEFLTNKRIYWEALWLDVLLRKYWNLVKNLANFWLWLYFVYIIFKWLISTWKESIASTLKNNLLWLLIAGIWIQVSWFLTAAVIDASTIALAAAWALPSQIMSKNSNVETSVEDNLKTIFSANWTKIDKPIHIDLFCKDSQSTLCQPAEDQKMDRPQTLTWLIDQMMPRADDVSWPLYFMWFSIVNISGIQNINSDDIKWTIFNLIIQWWTSIIFAIEMLILCVAALIRILYLWMFIVLSPLTILLSCMEQAWEKWLKESKLYKTIMKHINISSFLLNVFKPTIIVLWLWVATLFVSFMKTTVTNSAKTPFSDNGVTFSSTPSSSSLADEVPTYTSTMDHDLFSFTLKNVWKTLLELIFSILTVILVYQIVKSAVTMWGWKDFVSSSIDKVQKSVWSALWSVPLLPVAWYDKEWLPTTHYISANSVLNMSNGEPNSELLNKTIAKYQWKVTNVYNEQNEIVNSRFGDNNSWYLSQAEQRRIENASWENQMKTLEIKKWVILSIRNDENNKSWKWMTLNPLTAKNDGFWINQFWSWLTNMKNEPELTSWENYQIWNDMIKRWNSEDANKIEEKMKMQTLFTRVTYAAKAYAEYFFDEGDARRNISDWEHLKNADISRKA